MNRLNTFFIVILIALVYINCKANRNYEIQAVGIIQERDITTYQYGTHILEGNILYAPNSNNINLNNYLGKAVSLKGITVEGYPTDGGLEFLLVLEISE